MILKHMISKEKDYTIEYYNANAADFAASTVDALIGDTRKRFTELIPEGGRVLDFGCGSGRDTKCFIELGFDVEAVDGSEELAKLASEYTGIDVRAVLFQDFEETDRYDGIWACACLLHLNDEDLKDVLIRLQRALKMGGVLYASFKYGDYYGEKDGRFYNYMNEERFAGIFAGVSGLKITDIWLSDDSLRREKADRWFNVLMVKAEEQTENA